MAVALALQPPAQFDPHGNANTVNQRWTKWVKSFETFIVAAGCKDDEQKRQAFLHCAGESVQEIFSTLPDTGNSYNDAKVKLNEYFLPKQNVPYNRHVFRLTDQASDETIAQFVTRLRTLSIGCDFGDNLDDFLRDQVIEKCTS
jgi:hypothetical protein